MLLGNCGKCTLCGRTCVQSSGPAVCELMMIGEAPGQQEAIHGEPFYPEAKAGGMLTECCTEAGIDRWTARITNACLCHPEGNATPTIDQVEACLERLYSEVMMCAPKVIVTLGNIPTWAMLKMSKDMSGISTFRGNQYQWGSSIVIPTWHPSAVCRDPRRKPELISDLLLAQRTLG